MTSSIFNKLSGVNVFIASFTLADDTGSPINKGSNTLGLEHITRFILKESKPSIMASSYRSGVGTGEERSVEEVQNVISVTGSSGSSTSTARLTSGSSGRSTSTTTVNPATGSGGSSTFTTRMTPVSGNSGSSTSTTTVNTATESGGSGNTFTTRITPGMAYLLKVCTCVRNVSEVKNQISKCYMKSAALVKNVQFRLSRPEFSVAP
ncbi:mucin-19-like [Dysidea avara]|uniref:mucin-19-like n=1 Tax=Dysidea avara TaxID=196820 RepID=UPI003330F862